LLGGCHGDDERKVFDELCVIVEETIASFHADGDQLTPPTASRGFADKLTEAA
jgi:hypothetical protein